MIAISNSSNDRASLHIDNTINHVLKVLTVEGLCMLILTRLDTRLGTGGQGQYRRSLQHLKRSDEAKISNAEKVTDQRTDGGAKRIIESRARNYRN